MRWVRYALVHIVFMITNPIEWREKKCLNTRLLLRLLLIALWLLGLLTLLLLLLLGLLRCPLGIRSLLCGQCLCAVVL